MLRSVVLVRIDVSEELSTSLISVYHHNFFLHVFLLSPFDLTWSQVFIFLYLI
jgi:hypothetical protein